MSVMMRSKTVRLDPHPVHMHCGGYVELPLSLLRKWARCLNCRERFSVTHELGVRLIVEG